MLGGRRSGTPAGPDDARRPDGVSAGRSAGEDRPREHGASASKCARRCWIIGVVEFSWRLPRALKLRGNVGKWILRQVLYRRVPKQILERPKMGFSVPIDRWLRGPLRPWAENLLSPDELRQRRPAGPRADRARVEGPSGEPASGRRGAVGRHHVSGVEGAVGSVTAALRLPAPARVQAADAADARWDLLLVCVSAYILTAVGRVHELFPAVATFRPAIVSGLLATTLYVLAQDEQRRSEYLFRTTTKLLLAFLVWMFLSVSGALVISAELRALRRICQDGADVRGHGWRGSRLP